MAINLQMKNKIMKKEYNKFLLLGSIGINEFPAKIPEYVTSNCLSGRGKSTSLTATFYISP